MSFKESSGVGVSDTCQSKVQDPVFHFRNESGLEFVDISSEAARTYEWGDGRQVTVIGPLYLNVSRTGGHRLFDREGNSHYVPKGWIHLHWRAADGQPHFVK